MTTQGFNTLNPSSFRADLEYTSNETPDFTFMARIKEADSMQIVLGKTKDLFTPFTNLYFENSVLRLALKNQWRSYRYNQEYIQFLLGGYTEKEFLEVAKRYALPFTHIEKDQLGIGSSVILNVLGEAVTSGDLSFLLNVDPVDVETALEAYPFAHKYQENEGEEGGKTE